MSSTALSQFVAMLTMPILTRLYKPEDFGLLAVYGSIFSLLLIIASIRYELAVPLPKKDEDAANLLVLSLTIVLCFSILTIPAVYLLGDGVIRWVGAPALKPYLWLLSLSLLGAGSYQALSYWAIRKKDFTRIAQTKVSQSLGRTLSQVGLGFLHVGPIGLLLGLVAGQSLGFGTLGIMAVKNDKEAFKRISFERMRLVAYRYRRFPLISGSSGIINTIGLELQPLFMSAFYGPRVLGWFSLGEQVIGVPMSLLGVAVSQVYYGEASRLARESVEELKKLFSQTVKKLFMIGCIPITLLGIKGPWLFALVFGDIWQQAGVYTQLLTLLFVIKFVAIPLSCTLEILERQDLKFYWDIGRLGILLGVFTLARTFGWSDWLFVLSYSVVMSISYGILLILSYMVIKSAKTLHLDEK